MNLWIIIHHHGHGVDVYPVKQDKMPTTKEQEAACENFEYNMDEYTEVAGPWKLEDLKGTKTYHNEMPLKEFVEKYVIPNLAADHCYAAINNDTDEQDRDVYDIEIETTGNTIAAVWRVGSFKYSEAQKKALEIGTELERNNVTCFQNRKSWDEWLESQEDADE